MTASPGVAGRSSVVMPKVSSWPPADIHDACRIGSVAHTADDYPVAAGSARDYQAARDLRMTIHAMVVAQL
jgi:hypothetical protein